MLFHWREQWNPRWPLGMRSGARWEEDGVLWSECPNYTAGTSGEITSFVTAIREDRSRWIARSSQKGGKDGRREAAQGSWTAVGQVQFDLLAGAEGNLLREGFTLTVADIFHPEQIGVLLPDRERRSAEAANGLRTGRQGLVVDKQCGTRRQFDDQRGGGCGGIS